MFWNLIIGLASLSLGVYFFVKTKKEKVSISENNVGNYFLRQYTHTILIMLVGLTFIIRFFVEFFSE